MSSHPFLAEDFEVRWSTLHADTLAADVRLALSLSQKNINAIAETDLAKLTYENTFGALERASQPLETAWSRAMHLDSVADTPAQREAIRAVLPEVTEFSSSIPLNAGLWKVLKTYAESADAQEQSATRRRYIEETVENFKSEGADLEPSEKDKVAGIQSELSKLTKQFSENLMDSTNAWELIIDDASELAGLPEDAKATALADAIAKGFATEENPKWRFTLQQPSMSPVMQFAESDGLRRRIWEASIAIATEGKHDNQALVWKIIELRQALAKLLGKSNFADQVLARRMAKNGATALNFIENLHDEILPAFEKDTRELQEYKAAKTGAAIEPLQPWETSFWAEKRRKELYDFDEEELRPYFPINQIMKGMLDLCEELFSVRFKKRPTVVLKPGESLPEGSVEVWDEACEYYEVYENQDGKHIGSFYTDWHPRENKRGGAWMNPVFTGECSVDGHAPHWGVITGNMTKPVGNKPALFTHREVETVFHEFGHLLHHLFGNVEVAALSGSHVSWDFVELPSQIMENFCWERASLDRFARHYQTGECIPEALYQKMLRARTYMSASVFMRQLAFGKLDLELHCFPGKYDGKSMEEIDAEVLATYKMALKTPTPSFLPRMSHLFSSSIGYAAGYYSYKWAEVLDADAFSRFKAEGVINPQTGADFRRCILSKGNSESPEQLYRDFMGRDPDPKALLVRAGLA